jgi:hypothetical protein
MGLRRFELKRMQKEFKRAEAEARDKSTASSAAKWLIDMLGCHAADSPPHAVDADRVAVCRDCATYKSGGVEMTYTRKWPRGGALVVSGAITHNGRLIARM